MSAAPTICAANAPAPSTWPRRIRSPGSALKPLIYALAFESGIAHPETLLDDRPSRYGSYAPENFDLSFQGTVTARRALQLSLNVPAVELLAEVGPARFLARLRQAGAAIALPSDAAPGLAVGLGGLGITLADLTRLYVGLRRAAARCRASCARLDDGEARGRADAHRRSGRGLVRRRHPARRAAARARARRPDRLQDRHLLRLPRRLGGGLRPALHRRRLGRAPGRQRRCRASSAAPSRRRSCSMPSRGSASSRSRSSAAARPHGDDRGPAAAAAPRAQGRAEDHRRRRRRRRSGSPSPSTARASSSASRRPSDSGRRWC